MWVDRVSWVDNRIFIIFLLYFFFFVFLRWGGGGGGGALFREMNFVFSLIYKAEKIHIYTLVLRQKKNKLSYDL